MKKIFLTILVLCLVASSGTAGYCWANYKNKDPYNEAFVLGLTADVKMMTKLLKLFNSGETDKTKRALDRFLDFKTNQLIIAAKSTQSAEVQNVIREANAELASENISKDEK